MGEVQHGVDNANTTVEITINDLDDNLPIFSKNISTATVPENTTRAVLTFTNRIYVLDNDQVKFVTSQSYQEGLSQAI